MASRGSCINIQGGFNPYWGPSYVLTGAPLIRDIERPPAPSSQMKKQAFAITLTTGAAGGTTGATGTGAAGGGGGGAAAATGTVTLAVIVGTGVAAMTGVWDTRGAMLVSWTVGLTVEMAEVWLEAGRRQHGMNIICREEMEWKTGAGGYG